MFNASGYFESFSRDSFNSKLDFVKQTFSFQPNKVKDLAHQKYFRDLLPEIKDSTRRYIFT